MKLNKLLGAAALLASTFAASQANAYQTYFTADVGSFVDDSASATFLTDLGALGGSITHLNFNTGIGGPLAGNPINGNSISNDLVFSSALSGTFGGSNSANISFSGAGPNSEIGPESGWNGIFVIDFLAKNNVAKGVSFGTVELDAGEFIRVYDQNNTLIGTFNDASPTFSAFGVIGQGNQRIGRIELEGNFFAIQDITYSATAVPEPASMAMILAGMGMIGGIARRRQAK